MRSTARRISVLAAAAGAALIAAVLPASAATAADWPAYLNGPLHSSYNAAETAITPANAGTLVQKWHRSGGVLASPTVADGAVYIGTNAGYLEKINETTGALLDKYFIGRQPKKTCNAQGDASTATVSGDSVYVAGPAGYLYALSTASLALQWKSVIAIPSTTTSNYFNWSSPTVTGGKIYVGVSSQCDDPLIRGGEDEFEQSTGALLNKFYTVPSGSIGGSIWSSAAVDSGGDVYVSTGNPLAGDPNNQYTEAIIKLSPSLKPLGSFVIPKDQMTGDADFGGSPTVFGADVGACNKNGIYYALNRATMKLAWEQRLGAKSSGSTPAECDAAAAYNGTDIWVAGEATTIGGTSYRGSVQERTPAGALVWQTGLPNGVIGSPTLDGGGVLAAGTYDRTATPNATYLFDAATGNILSTLDSGSDDFGQSVFADGMLFLANESGVSAWAP
jgi:polyvinyl alcohol dehydrogenase (cytochrome)